MAISFNSYLSRVTFQDIKSPTHSTYTYQVCFRLLHGFSVELFYEYFVVFEKKAGIPGAQLTLAVESESAALYCQSGTHLSGLEPMNPGDKFLLLDCGGILCVMNIDFSNA